MSKAKSSKKNKKQVVEVDEDALRESIRKEIIDEIEWALTEGKEDDDLEPYSKEQVESFIKQHDEDITEVIEEIITAYKNDNELEDLVNREKDWVKEYLYAKDWALNM